MRPLKRNDVIAYTYNSKHVVAIVRGRIKRGVSLYAVRHEDWPVWRIYGPRQGLLPLIDGDIEDLHLHPDPATIWASFVAAQLRGEVR